MKKLMVAAAAVAMLGAASATQVADYRATVKYVDTQKWSKPIMGKTPFVKVVKITTLRGYVVYDDCVSRGRGGVASSGTIAPAFLVVKSFAQTDDLPKILPADLIVKMIDNRLGQGDPSEEFGAEGYLFAGAGKGSHEILQDAVCGVAPWMPDKGYQFGSQTKATRFLFGKYNDVSAQDEFFDTWLDHAGFGSAWDDEANKDEGAGDTDIGDANLKKLMGYLIGGSYNFHLNGDSFEYEWFPCHSWLGTTDVVTGYWGMKKIGGAPAELSKDDGMIYEALLAAKRDGDPDADAIGRVLGQVKACVAKMTNGKFSNLAFITDETTVTKFMWGFEYECEYEDEDE